jgi:hypothetical protein
MKRALQALISLYPRAWRNRYQAEFEALLDQVPPTWRMLFDVLGGATKMQFKTGSAWKIIAGCGVIGLLTAGVFSATTPDRFVARTLVRTSDTRAALVWLSRSSLTQIILNEGLYRDERRKTPLEDVIGEMKNKDIGFEPGGPGSLVVSFAAPQADQAQRVANRLAASLVDAKAATLIEPANLPTLLVGPRRSRIFIMGLMAGILAGALIALFNGLKVWKLAVALGMACAALGAMVSFLLPERYASTAVIWYSGADAPAAVNRLIAAAEPNASFAEIAMLFKLYPGDPQAGDKVREHLRIQRIRSAQNVVAVTVRFEYGDRYLAQKVAQDVVSRLMDEPLRGTFREDAGMMRGGTLQLLDPASLPIQPYFPNRPMVTALGLLVGLGCAIALGLWRMLGERRLEHA